MMDITIGSPSSSDFSRSCSSCDYTQRLALAGDAAGGSGSNAAGLVMEVLAGSAGLDDTNDGGGHHHRHCGPADPHGGFDGYDSDRGNKEAGASRSPSSLGDGEETCRTPPSIPLSASQRSSWPFVPGSGGAAYLPPRHAPQKPPHERLHSRVEGMTRLCAAADRERGEAPAPWPSGSALFASEERRCSGDTVGVSGPRSSPPEAEGRASEPTGVAAAVPDAKWLERDEQGPSRAFARTESPSPLCCAAQTELGTADAERNAATEASLGTEVPGARCGPLGTHTLPSFSTGGSQDVVDSRPRSEHVLQLARVNNAATLLSPTAPPSTSTSAVPLSEPPPLSSAPSTSASAQQQRLRLPSRSLESASSASFSRPVGQRESLSGVGVAAPTSSDSNDGSDAYDHHCSRRQWSDFCHRAVGDVDDDDGTSSSSPGLTEANGARPPSHAPAPFHPFSFLTQTLQHACRRSQSSSDSTKERYPCETQLSDVARQALNLSKASSPASSPLASRSPSSSAPPSAQLPPRYTIDETGRDSSSNGWGSGAARRIPQHGTGTTMTEVAESPFPLATPTVGAVGCGGGGAAAVAGESPPPLPPAPRGAGDGAFSLRLSLGASHRHSKNSATGTHGVARQATASEADVANEALAGEGEARTSCERTGLPTATSPRGGVATALEVVGARCSAAPLIDDLCRAQPPPQGRALDRWRSEASVAGRAAAESAAFSSCLPAATHSPCRSATQQVAGCDDDHPLKSARGSGETAKSPLKGVVNVARWVCSTAGREADRCWTSPPAREAAEARVCVHRTNLDSRSTASAPGTAGSFCGSEPPPVVAGPLAAPPHCTSPHEVMASAALAEAAQSCASGVLAPGRQACETVSALSRTSSSRSRMRLTVITSPEQKRRSGNAEHEVGVGVTAPVDPLDRSSGARWREAGRGGKTFHVCSGDARRTEMASVQPRISPPHERAAVLRRTHPLRGASGGQCASRPGLTAVLATGASAMASLASSAGMDGANEDEEARIVARTWRPATRLEFVRADVCRPRAGDDRHNSWGAARTHRWGQGMRHSRAAPGAAAIDGALSGRQQAQPTNRIRNDAHGHVLSIEASSLSSSVSLAAEATSDVGAGTREACSAATRRAGGVSNGADRCAPSSTTLAPGYAAVYSPRMLATRVLEARKVLLGTSGAGAPAAATSVCTLGPPGTLPLQCGSRAMPAVGAAVAAAALSGGAPSWSLSSMPSPPHAHIDLRERSADDGVMPAATAHVAPWSLCLSRSPDAEESTREPTALPQQPTRGQRRLYEQPDVPASTSPYPVARRIPFGFTADTAAEAASPQAVSPSADGCLRTYHVGTASPAADASAPVPGEHRHAESGHQRAGRRLCHTPAGEPRSATASARSSPVMTRSAGVCAAGPLGHMPTVLFPTTASSSARRASSVGTAQGPHRSSPPPERHAITHGAGGGSPASERVHSTSRRFAAGPTNADQGHDAPSVRHGRPSHILAQQRLIEEEAFRRRYIGMQEDHRFAMEVAELNYQRAAEYVHLAASAGAVEALDQRSGHRDAVMTADYDGEGLVGLQGVRRDQAAMTATLSMLVKELSALSSP
ncbi:5'a2rel-related protein [Leishmania tarentolae]|uniref:5'a2rel-related protein n=1 Tax=Leishmania tarentolae TaxID=5689 RepID=A0A640KG75_LEITA|nr:5'a2rel-related protein [Leishmania tarentolae]GET88553.1 5'a2rel-related protein [Leishmania tarentolae]